MAYVYPFEGNFPVTETHAAGDPGVDWGMPNGTPIYAIAGGTVVKVGAPGYGPNYVEIDHGGNIQSFYGHGSAALVHVGQQVAQGQEIALSGNLGNSTGPHLELGVRVNGQLVDPISFLQKQGASQMTNPAGTPGLSSLITGSGTMTGSTSWTGAQIAASMGLTDSLFNSSPDLKRVLAEAQASGLTPDTAQGQAEFKALLQATGWYKQHSDAARKWEVLVTADPGEAQRQRQQMLATVAHTAASMGVTLTGHQEFILAAQALQTGLSSDELKFSIASHFQANKTGQYGGDAGKLADGLRQTAQNYGMPSSALDVGRQVYQIMNGKSSEQAFTAQAQQYAKGMFPGLSAAIDSGQTVRDAAQPYLQVYSQTLERDSNAVDLTKESSLRQALSYKPIDAQGKPIAGAQPSTMPLWQYEHTLKQDPRWLGTDNAQTSILDAGTKVLKDMGLQAQGA